MCGAPQLDGLPGETGPEDGTGPGETGKESSEQPGQVARCRPAAAAQPAAGPGRDPRVPPLPGRRTRSKGTSSAPVPTTWKREDLNGKRAFRTDSDPARRSQRGTSTRSSTVVRISSVVKPST